MCEKAHLLENPGVAGQGWVCIHTVIMKVKPASLIVWFFTMFSCSWGGVEKSIIGFIWGFMPRWLVDEDKSKEAESICQGIVFMKHVGILPELDEKLMSTLIMVIKSSKSKPGKEEHIKEFLGGSGVRIPCSHCWGPDWNPGQETKIPQAISGCGAPLPSKRRAYK